MDNSGTSLGSTFTEKDRNKLNYRIGPLRSDSAIKLVSDLITESDQAVRAVHSCNSWSDNLNGPCMEHYHDYHVRVASLREIIQTWKYLLSLSLSPEGLGERSGGCCIMMNGYSAGATTLPIFNFAPILDG